MNLEPLEHLALLNHAVYLALSIGVTVLVGRTLHRNGRLFLIEAFGGDQGLADSVNHLMLVGLYLVNIGFVAIALRYGGRPDSAPAAVEMLSTKVGVVLLALGAVHFCNLVLFSLLRRRAKPAQRPFHQRTAAALE